ncbi:hypothetical protein ABZ747_29480 [Kitasatospora cineracea]|uniref:hypothetical protein n=1 Tax=Kitasatospora cineracea TaxID=88074 RepID=UPI0034005299
MVDALGVSKHTAIKIPPLRGAVRDLLRAGRTPEHALARINAGWWRAGVPERIQAGEIRGPVGYLAAILSSRECARPDCERGLLLESGKECSACGLRAAERQAERARVHLERETAALEQTGWPRPVRRPTSQALPQQDARYGAVTWRG